MLVITNGKCLVSRGGVYQFPSSSQPLTVASLLALNVAGRTVGKDPDGESAGGCCSALDNRRCWVSGSSKRPWDKERRSSNDRKNCAHIVNEIVRLWIDQMV